MLRQTIRGLVTEGANRLERARAAGKADDALVATALPGGVQRGMYTVGWLARIIEDLGCVTSEAKWEAEYEADNSQVPAALAAQVSQLGAILVAMAMEEATELAAKFSDLASGSVAQAAEAKDVGEANDAGASVEQLARGLALVAKTPELRRAMSAEKKLARSMQKIHDNAVECGAMCQSVARAAGITAGGPAEGDDMTKDEVQAIVDGSLKRFLGVADAPAAPAPDPAPATPAAEGGFLMRAITAAVTAAVAPVAAKVETLEQRITDPKVQRALTATGDPAPAQPGRDPQATSVTVAPAKGAEATGGAQTPEVLRGVDPQVVDHMARRFGAGPQLQRAMADLTANTGAVELHAMPELARSMDQAGERARLALAGRLLRAVIADGPTVQIDSKPREVAII